MSGICAAEPSRTPHCRGNLKLFVCMFTNDLSADMKSDRQTMRMVIVSTPPSPAHDTLGVLSIRSIQTPALNGPTRTISGTKLGFIDSFLATLRMKHIQREI
ncbi:MAG: hypothetical protein M3N34_09280 [Pseudomonadota bacterium]|nr:hypothetical protein [Pseudomonadota bacterium]